MISVIIPNYNGAKLLNKNLPHVFRALVNYHEKTKTSYEIIIPDDASIDNSERVVESLGFPVTYLKHTKNVGFASNVNRGVAKARGDILLLLNTDVSPDSEFLFALLDHFREETVFAVGCLEKSIEPGGETQRGRGVGKWERGFLAHRRGEVTKSDTLWASGGSSAFRKSKWDKLGGLLSLYDPFYWEDIDLSYRAMKAGDKIIFEPKSYVTHVHEAGSIKTQFSKKTITAVAYRNQFFFVWLNITERKLIISHLLWLPYHLVSAVFHRDREFVFGFLSAVSRLGEVIRQRRENKKLFHVADSQILSRF